MESPDRQVGPYKIIQEIGRGGMATIYLASDTRTNQRIALKILLPQYTNDPITLRRFRQEGENSKRLRHHNIIKIFEAGIADGAHYIAMEYASGGTLAQLLKNKGRPLSVEEAVPILNRVASALDYAHSRNILHRDVKPSNILIGESGQLLLSDFGVARQIASDATVVTTIGFSVGTPSYMSPEQAQGDYDLTPRSDIYSLGVVAYAMLTSALPFDAESQLVLLRKIIDNPPISPDVHNAQLPAGVSYALQRVLAKDPQTRYATAGEFVNALEQGATWQPTARDWSSLINSGTAKVAIQSAPVYAAPPTPDRRNLSGTIAVSLGMVAVLLSAFALLRPDIRSYLLAVGVPASVTALLPGELQQSTEPLPKATVGAAAIPAIETPTPVPTNTEAATVTSEPPTATFTPVIIQMMLVPLEDQNLNVRLNVPQNWRQSHLGSALYFESTDHLALFFIDRLPQTLDTLTAQEAIVQYLAEANTPFSSLELTSKAQTDRGDATISEQTYDGVLIGGVQTVVQLSLIQHEGQSYLFGSSTVPANAATLAPILKLIVDGIVFLAEPTATFTETAIPSQTSTKTETFTPTASATATRRPTSTPVPTDTETATPIPSPTQEPTSTTVSTPTPSTTPNLTATEQAQLDIVSTYVAETLTALPTNTPNPTNTPTPLFTSIPTKPPTATETHTTIPTVAPTNTPDTDTLPEPSATLGTTDATLTALVPFMTHTANPATATPILTSIPAAPSQPGLISGFEAFGAWQRGDEPYGQFSQSQTQVYEGNYSGELAYDIASNAGDQDYVVFLAQSPLRIPNDTSKLEMQVYGDNSGNFLNIWIGDASGQLYQFNFGQIHHTGWQAMQVSFDLNQAWPNGPISPTTITQLTPPLTVKAFVLDHHPDSSLFKSNIYLDALRGITDEASAPGSSQPEPAQPANGSQSVQATATSASAAAPVSIGGLQGRLAVPVFNGTNMDILIYNVADGSVLTRYNNRRQPDYGKCGGILLANGDGGGINDIVRIFPDGSTRNVAVNIEDSWPQWSPSCQSVAYASTKQGDGRWRVYWQVDASDAFNAPPLKYNGFELRGRYTVYLDNWRIAFNGCNYWASGSNCGIYTTDTSGGQPGTVTDQSDDIPSDALSNRILFHSQRSGNWDIWIVNFDGSGLQQLTNSPAVDGLATVAPDNQYIAFLTNRDGNWAIYVMNVDGSNQQKLFNVDGGYGGGDYDWSQERLSWGQ